MFLIFHIHKNLLFLYHTSIIIIVVETQKSTNENNNVIHGGKEKGRKTFLIEEQCEMCTKELIA